MERIAPGLVWSWRGTRERFQFDGFPFSSRTRTGLRIPAAPVPSRDIRQLDRCRFPMSDTNRTVLVGLRFRSMISGAPRELAAATTKGYPRQSTAIHQPAPENRGRAA